MKEQYKRILAWAAVIIGAALVICGVTGIVLFNI